jgi:hypothetical protein
MPNEKFDHLAVPISQREMQWGGIFVILGINSRAMLNQQFDHLEVPLDRDEMQGR